MSLNLYKIGTQIKNEKFINFLKKSILDLWRCKKDMYPSTVPVILNKESFERFTTYDYFVTSHLKHPHIQLFFLNDLFNKPITVICDKLFNFYKVKIDCIPNVYLKTLFDCQIREIDGNFVIFINDCVAMNGNSIKNMAFEYRLSSIETFLNSCILETNNRILFQQKLFYKLKTVADFIEEITEYNLDLTGGLQFIPNKLPLICGTQKSNMYWLKNNDYTVDLTVEIEPDTEDLLLYCYNLKVKTLYARIHKEHNPELINTITSLDNFTSGSIVEFKVNNKTLEPTIVKIDKSFPNGLRIIETVLYAIKQNITLEDIKNLKDIK